MYEMLYILLLEAKKVNEGEISGKYTTQYCKRQ